MLLNTSAFRQRIRPSFRRKKLRQKSKDVPIASFAVNIAKELLHETSESPAILAATPSNLRRNSFVNLCSSTAVIPHSCDKRPVSLHSNKYEPFPYQPLKSSG